jgi:glyoxylase-like metal-dependent hydrolase (beta-lactamase superfamily II)
MRANPRVISQRFELALDVRGVAALVVVALVLLGGAFVLGASAGRRAGEAHAIAADAVDLAGRTVTHVVLTHNHFDHILGSSVFAGAAIYAAPEISATVAAQAEHLRADAIRHGADPDEVARAIAALRMPEHQISRADLDLGGKTVAIIHPGRGHTGHDLIAVVAEPAVVFCGDLVEESGDPVADDDSDPAAWPTTLGRVLAAGGPDARYVPGHGAVVDAAFVERQRRWLQNRV